MSPIPPDQIEAQRKKILEERAANLTALNSAETTAQQNIIWANEDRLKARLNTLSTVQNIETRVAGDAAIGANVLKQATAAGASTWTKVKLSNGITQWTRTTSGGTNLLPKTSTMNSYRIGGTTGFTAANRAQFYAEIRRGTAKAEKSLWSTISRSMPTGARPNRPAGGYIGAAQSLVGGPGYTYKAKSLSVKAYSAWQIMQMKAAGVKLR